MPLSFSLQTQVTLPYYDIERWGHSLSSFMIEQQQQQYDSSAVVSWVAVIGGFDDIRELINDPDVTLLIELSKTN